MSATIESVSAVNELSAAIEHGLISAVNEVLARSESVSAVNEVSLTIEFDSVLTAVEEVLLKV